MKISFIRHCNTVANSKNQFSGFLETPYSELGEEQFIALCKKLPALSCQKVYTSPLSRCTRIAQEICRIHRVPVITDKRLREVDFGGFDGHNREECQALFPEVFAAWQADRTKVTYPNGESYSLLRKRLIPFLEEVITQNEDIAITTHRGVIQTACAHLLQLPLASMWNFAFDNGSITEIQVVQGNCLLTTIQ